MSIYDAKTQLSKLVDEVVAGNSVVITRRGKAIVQLSKVVEKNQVIFGLYKDQWPKWDTEAGNGELLSNFSSEVL